MNDYRYEATWAIANEDTTHILSIDDFGQTCEWIYKWKMENYAALRFMNLIGREESKHFTSWRTLCHKTF